MLILVWESYEGELLVRHVGVHAEVRGEVISGVHGGPMPVEVAIENLVNVLMHLRDQIRGVSVGPAPAEDYGELTVFIVKSPYAPLKTDSYVPSSAFCVVEGLAVGEGGALGVSDEDTLDSGYGLRE